MEPKFNNQYVYSLNAFYLVLAIIDVVVLSYMCYHNGST